MREVIIVAFCANTYRNKGMWDVGEWNEYPSYTYTKHFLMMVKQISGFASPDSIIDQIFPTFYPNVNSPDVIINNIIISYMNTVALKIGLLF